MEQTRAEAAETIRRTLDDAEVTWERPDEDTFVVTLPGTRKLKTTCALKLGRHTLTVRATDADGVTQTEQEAPPAPDGATGWHSVELEIR